MKYWYIADRWALRIGAVLAVILTLVIFNLPFDDEAPKAVPKLEQPAHLIPKEVLPEVELAQYSASERIPNAEADFSPFQINLTRYYLSDADLERIKSDEVKYEAGEKGTIAEHNKNSVKVLGTKFGTFQVVSSFGHQSINRDGFHYGGMRYDMMQLPNGKWMLGLLNIQEVLEVNGRTYLICDHDVIQVTGPETLTAVVSFVRHGKWVPNIRCKEENIALTGRYWEVHKSNDSDFGGLLEYHEGQWKFHAYTGSYKSWIDGCDEDEGNLKFKLFRWDEKKDLRKQVSFDATTGTFTDL